MASRVLLIVAIVVGVIVAGVAAALAIPTGPTNNQDEQIREQLMSPTISSASALGSNDARVTIVEFGDYQCTWCYRWHEGTKDTLVADYVDTGKVRFLFKDYPINDLSDRASSLAAEGSYCAADQGKYWEYHDTVYSNWDGENTGWVTRVSIERFAKDAGVSNKDAFSDCLDSGKYDSTVRANYNLARSVGLDATPSFIVLVDGKTPQLMRGAHPYSTFEKVINEAYAN